MTKGQSSCTTKWQLTPGANQFSHPKLEFWNPTFCSLINRHFERLIRDVFNAERKWLRSYKMFSSSTLLADKQMQHHTTTGISYIFWNSSEMAPISVIFSPLRSIDFSAEESILWQLFATAFLGINYTSSCFFFFCIWTCIFLEFRASLNFLCATAFWGQCSSLFLHFRTTEYMHHLK